MLEITVLMLLTVIDIKQFGENATHAGRLADRPI